MTYRGIDGHVRYPCGFVDTICAVRKKLDPNMRGSARFSFHVVLDAYGEKYCHYCLEAVVPTGRRGTDLGLNREIEVYAVDHIIEEEPV